MLLGVVCGGKTGAATLELTGTVSVLQPNLCKIQVETEKGVMLGAPFLGRVGGVGSTLTVG